MADPIDFANEAFTQPTPIDPTAVTDAEREEILDWLAKDARVKLRIDQTISQIIAHLPGGVSNRAPIVGTPFSILLQERYFGNKDLRTSL